MKLLLIFFALACLWWVRHPRAVLRALAFVAFSGVAAWLVVRDRRRGLGVPWTTLALLAGGWELHGLRRKLTDVARERDGAAYAQYVKTGGARARWPRDTDGKTVPPFDQDREAS